MTANKYQNVRAALCWTKEIAALAIAMVDRFNEPIELFTETAFNVEDLDPSQYKDVFDDPTTFDEARNHPDPFQRKKWREAIKKEFDKMGSRNVWTKIKRSAMEDGRRCVKHKWVFNIKRNGIFRARLVACGYSQIAGTDFNEIYAPVANDVTFRLLLIEMLIRGLEAMIFDVETAFLMGDLDTTIYMDCPMGMDHEDDEVLLLNKTIYGLVQSARLYNHKFAKTIIDLGFKQCEADPCLFKREKNGDPCVGETLCCISLHIIAHISLRDIYVYLRD